MYLSKQIMYNMRLQCIQYQSGDCRQKDKKLSPPLWPPLTQEK